MPTYEYECTKCGIVFELMQPITEPTRRKLKKSDPKPCNCAARITRLISGGGAVIFKGSGFFQTDYRSESYKKAEKADKEASSGEKSKSSDDGKKSGGDSKKESSSSTDKTATKKTTD